MFIIKTKRLFLLILFPSLLLLNGCEIALPKVPPMEWPPVTVLGAPVQPSPRPEPPPEDLTPAPVEYAVQFETDISLALYEPDDGCYIGAQTGQPGGPAAFNKTAGKKHAVFVHEMRIGDDFPVKWILTCIREQAAPLVILRPPGEDVSFLLPDMRELARQFGAYNIPLFIAYHPLPHKPAYTPGDYSLYYRYARVIFQELAPQAAFVWAADITAAEAPAEFYPGDASVDWVAVNAPDTLTGGKYDAQMTESVSHFYHAFQHKKPVMLLSLGVSHFSTEDYAYRIPPAAERISDIYKTAERLWPRVKMIVYHDMNKAAGQETPDKNIKDDFSISGERELQSAYKQAVGGGRYLAEIQISESRPTGMAISQYPAVYTENRVYIDQRVLDEMNAAAPAETVEMDGNIYVEAPALEKYSLYAVTDHARKLVTVYEKIESEY